MGTEYILDLLEKFELTLEEHQNIFNYCHENNILYMCTPWDSDSIVALESLDVKAYKVASADLTNLPLIENLIATQKPLILSTGMSSCDEIQITANFLNSRNAEFVLLHCNSTYPAPFHDINLNWIKKLRDIHSLIGYSGHERGIAVTLAAVGLGLSAAVIETSTHVGLAASLGIWAAVTFLVSVGVLMIATRRRRYIHPAASSTALGSLGGAVPPTGAGPVPGTASSAAVQDAYRLGE